MYAVAYGPEGDQTKTIYISKRKYINHQLVIQSSVPSLVYAAAVLWIRQQEAFSDVEALTYIAAVA